MIEVHLAGGPGERPLSRQPLSLTMVFTLLNAAEVLGANSNQLCSQQDWVCASGDLMALPRCLLETIVGQDGLKHYKAALC